MTVRLKLFLAYGAGALMLCALFVAAPFVAAEQYRGSVRRVALQTKQDLARAERIFKQAIDTEEEAINQSAVNQTIAELARKLEQRQDALPRLETLGGLLEWNEYYRQTARLESDVNIVFRDAAQQVTLLAQRAAFLQAVHEAAQQYEGRTSDLDNPTHLDNSARLYRQVAAMRQAAVTAPATETANQRYQRVFNGLADAFEKKAAAIRQGRTAAVATQDERISALGQQMTLLSAADNPENYRSPQWYDFKPAIDQLIKQL